MPAAEPTGSGIASEPASASAPTSEVVAMAGNTAPGPYYLGRLDAPVRIDEYSDFQ
jgi:hypothetical protein